MDGALRVEVPCTDWVSRRFAELVQASAAAYQRLPGASHESAITHSATQLPYRPCWRCNDLTQPSVVICAASSPTAPFIVMDAFCLRSFLPPAHSGSASRSIPGTPDEFVLHVNEVYQKGQTPLREGYAPFCKHLFIPNHLNVDAAYCAITDDNRHLLQSVTHTEH